jgi:hypothetical protein
MGIIFNLVDKFFKELENKAADKFYDKVKNSEIHPEAKKSLEKMLEYEQKINELTSKKERKIIKGASINKDDLKIKKENLKQVKLKFESYYTDLNERNITEEFDIIKYLKKEYKESDLFCQEFIESYIDRIDYIKYEKEIEEKSKIRKQYFIDKNEKIRKRDTEIIQKYGKEIAAKILKGKYWEGMTKAMLIESLGNPGTKKVDIFKDNEKLKFYYNKKRNQLGNWSFTLEISLENNKVVGWKDLDLISKRIDLD